MRRKLRALFLSALLAAPSMGAVGAGTAAVGTAVLTTGCGLGAVAIGALCIPCEALILGGIAISYILLDHGHHRHKVPPPVTPPEEPPLLIHTWNVPTSECPIVGVYVDGVPIAETPMRDALPEENAPPGTQVLDLNQMIWPDRPEFVQYRGPYGNDWNHAQVWTDEGGTATWVTMPGELHYVEFLFNNGQSVGRSVILEEETTFEVEWNELDPTVVVSYP